MRDEPPIWDRARGRWREILPQLADVDTRTLLGKHCPCPLCGGKDRWRFDDKDGNGTSICGQCGARTGMQLLMAIKGWDFGTAAREIEKVIGHSAAPPPSQPAGKEAAERYAEARGYWRDGVKITPGDPVDLYLRSRVGHVEPKSLRLIPATSFSGKRMPAMVAAYVDVNGDLAGVQRTFLTEDGRKYPNLESDRWNTGSLPDGGAIRLAAYDKILGIAEGIETALSASCLFGVPVWAALNANRLKAWLPPEGVREIVIFGDNDLNCVGQAAAYTLGERLNRPKTVTAQVMIPEEPGADWNDVLAARKCARAARHPPPATRLRTRMHVHETPQSPEGVSEDERT